MDWLWALALLPVLLCGLMCVGGVVLAALGLRQLSSSRRPCCDDDHFTTESDRRDEVAAGR